MLVEWCEARGRRFSDLIIKIKVGDYEDVVFESFDSNDYCFVSDYDWWEGENTIQILDIKRLDDVFDDDKYNKAKMLLRMAEVGEVCDCVCSKNCPLDEWLTELKEAKRLLKAAMEDMKILYETGKDEGCIGIEFKWRYADEALKLLNDVNIKEEK